MKEKTEAFVNILNRKARHEYEILDTWKAGIVLQGTEVKSVRRSKVNLQDAYCQFRNDELFIVNLHISPYAEGSYNNHQPKSDRKLLLKRSELNKIQDRAKDQGIAMIPLRLYINDRGLIKVEFGVGRGKKLFDKRDDIKEKDLRREKDRMQAD
ncbi:MAG: SsrA-binding protein SmpB [Bacteroidota bacterium]